MILREARLENVAIDDHGEVTIVHPLEGEPLTCPPAVGERLKAALLSISKTVEVDAGDERALQMRYPGFAREIDDEGQTVRWRIDDAQEPRWLTG